MKIFCLVPLLLICGCSSVSTIDTIHIGNSDISYVKAKTTNPFSGGSILVLDRYQTVDGKTTLIRTDSTASNSTLKSTLENIPFPIIP